MYSFFGVSYFSNLLSVHTLIIYVLIVSVLITGNVYSFLFQRVLSNCAAIIMLMSSYLVFNDDLLINNFLNFNNSVLNDYLSFFTKLQLFLFSTFYFLVNSDFFKEQKLISFEYLLIVMFSILGFLLMCSSSDLLTSYLSIELSAFSLYILASFNKMSSYSVDSAIKYYITGAVSSAFYLLGSSFIYGSSGSIYFSDFYNLYISSNIYINNNFEFYNIWSIQQFDLLNFSDIIVKFNFLEFGVSLLVISLFIKIALAPFHLWSVDVYEDSPTSSTFFFAVFTKLSVFILLLRICYYSFINLKNCWQFYSILAGFLSIFTGAVAGITQRKIKSLLAYSSVSHMGYLLIAFSTASCLGIQMLLFYLFFYMFSGLCIWYIFLLLKIKKKYLKIKYSKELSDLILLKNSNSGLALCLALIMFSIAGIPPIIGFLAKISVFLTVIGASFFIVAVISILCSLVSTLYYIRIIKILYFENVLVGKLYFPINSTKTIVLSFFNFFLVYMFINPTFLYLISYRSVFLFC